MTILVLDTFEGTGSLEGHTADSGLTWTDGSEPGAPEAYGFLQDGKAMPEFNYDPGNSSSFDLRFRLYDLPEMTSLKVATTFNFSTSGGGGEYIRRLHIGVWRSGEEVPDVQLSCWWGENSGFFTSMSVYGDGPDVPEEGFGIGLHNITFTAESNGRLTLKANQAPLVVFDSGSPINTAGSYLAISYEAEARPPIDDSEFFPIYMRSLRVEALTEAPLFWQNRVRASERP